jgi:hypothetical protein
MKHLAAFFAIGALLFGVSRGLDGEERERPRLVVDVPQHASPGEVERIIDQAVLIDLALRDPAALRADPIVREQLLRAMEGVRDRPGERVDASAQLERAIALGAYRADPVVRERLAFQGSHMLRARSAVPRDGASEAELAAYLARHEARYREPARATFRQLHLSRTRRGAELEADARTLAARLQGIGPDDPGLPRLSDPTILPMSMSAASEREIDARFGPGVGKAVLASRERAWSGPIASSYGLIFVWVEARSEARLPALHELESRVRSDAWFDGVEARLARDLATLRKSYDIDVRRSGS